MRYSMKTISENIKQIIALLVIATGIVYIYLTTFYEIKAKDSQGLIAVVTWVGIALNYYLGSTTGMGKKDETINNLTKNKNE